ncbi:MAG: HNH endonuclease [Kouleothrix sp.]
MTEVLVLNASYEPLRIVPVRRAIVLLLQEKAELVEAAAERIRAPGVAYAVPLVVRLVRYVAIPRGRKLPCARRLVITRDRETCQYCGAQPGRAHLTLDHVVPRARGGVTNWENVVAACAYNCARLALAARGRCSHARAARQPVYVAFALLGTLERHAVWQKYAYG